MIGEKPHVGSASGDAKRRRRVMDAAFALMVGEHKIPTPENLAEKSGLSVDEITNTYPTLDAMADDIRATAAAAFSDFDEAMPASGSLPEMLDDLVALRSQLYETTSDLRRLGDAAEFFLPSIAKAKAVREGRYRGQLTDLLAPHVGEQAGEFATRIELLTSWETWRHLRTTQCLTIEQAREVMQTLVAAVASPD